MDFRNVKSLTIPEGVVNRILINGVEVWKIIPKIEIILSGEQLISLENLSPAPTSINWGDGTIDSNLTHTFQAGSYTITSDDFENVTNLGANFLDNRQNLTSANIYDFKNVTTIGSYFCSRNTNFLAIPNNFLSGFESLTTIGTNFCYNAKFTSIGNNFMKDCKALTSITGAYLANLLNRVVSIGNYFMYNCSSLTSIDFSTTTTLQSLTTIGTNFMNNCSALTSITFNQSLTTIINVGDYFMNGCSSLQTATLFNYNGSTNSSSPTDIPNYFMYGLPNLSSVSLPFGAGYKYYNIGNHFLSECPSLSSISRLTNPRFIKIGDYFLSCNSIGSLTNTLSFGNTLVNTTEIGKEFLSHQPLTSITFSTSASEASSVKFDSGFMASSNVSSSTYTSILNYFRNKLTEIGTLFTNTPLSNDTTANIVFDLPYVTTIGINFLVMYKSTSIDLRAMTSLIRIEENFLYLSNISSLYLPVITPPTLESWGNNATISEIVCGAKLSEYQTANVWSSKADLMVES